MQVSSIQGCYNKDLAKQFKLEGSEKRDPFDMLPKLSVDAEIPYKPKDSWRRKSHVVNAALKGTAMRGMFQ